MTARVFVNATGDRYSVTQVGELLIVNATYTDGFTAVHEIPIPLGTHRDFAISGWASWNNLREVPST